MLKKRCRPVLGTDGSIDVIEHQAIKVRTPLARCAILPPLKQSSNACVSCLSSSVIHLTCCTVANCDKSRWLQMRAVARSHKLNSKSIIQQLQETHTKAEESYWATVAETAKLRAAHLRSSDFNTYLEEVNKEGNQFVGKLLQESADCLTQTIDRLQTQQPSSASGMQRTHASLRAPAVCNFLPHPKCCCSPSKVR